MAKQKKQAPTPQPAVAASPVAGAPASPSFSFYSFRTQAIILALIAIIFYANTFKNEYAFDDMMAIVSNDYVARGVAGIGDIMTKDAYQSYLEHRNGSNQLAGGRYRPLSLVTFAIEQQLLGVSASEDANGENRNRSPEEEQKLINDMHFRHVVNVLLFAFSVIVLLYFLRYIIFPNEPLAAFAAALLFTIHPIHTEVVANVKSRDEILSVLFILLTFISAFRFKEKKERKYLVWGSVFFFLALLSKEYAATLLVLLPLSFYLFSKETIQQSLKSLLPFLIPFSVYVLLRLTSVSSAAEGADQNIMNNPYLFATGMQKLATEIFVILKYLLLLFVPSPLTADYSYNQIPYRSFTDPMVLASVVVHVALIGMLAYLIIKRNVLAFPLALYFANLALISNFLFNIGAPMGERLIYHSSIGFVILIVALLFMGLNKLNAIKIPVLAGILLVVTLVSGYATITRNQAWVNNNTLFLTDVKTSPNSVLANTNAGSACMSYAKLHKDDTTESKKWFTDAIGYFDKAIKVNPEHMLAYLNRGLCYFNMRQAEKALPDWDTVRARAPGTPALDKYLSIAGKYFFGQGMQSLQNNNVEAAIVSFRHAADAAPGAPEIWYQLAVALEQGGQHAEAAKAVTKSLQINPKNPGAQELANRLGAGLK